jgi:four helix bundle protein
MAKTVNDLVVYQKAMAAAKRAFALIERPRMRADGELRRQIDKGSVRIPSDIAEGFEQTTDRSFAKYLTDARGSAREICTQLQITADRYRDCRDDALECLALYEEIARMLSGLIAYLQREDRQHRHGRG